MAISISNLTIGNNAAGGTAIGVLSAMDATGTVIPCNFVLTKNSAGFFAISDNKLVTAWSGAIAAGNYSVRIQAIGTTSSFSARATFSIAVTASATPAPPLPANTLLADTGEPLMVDTGIPTLVK
jgi:hypothetical protein